MCVTTKDWLLSVPPGWGGLLLVQGLSGPPLPRPPNWQGLAAAFKCSQPLGGLGRWPHPVTGDGEVRSYHTRERERGGNQSYWENSANEPHPRALLKEKVVKNTASVFKALA